MSGQHVTIVTDQKSVAFMIDNRRRSKTKNDKIQGWLLELAKFSYDISYCPDCDNIVADVLSRTTSDISNNVV